jgi:hypothetical protein
MKSSTSILLVAVIGLAHLVAGCATPGMQMEAARVRVLEPRPLVDLADSDLGMRIEFDASVADKFTVPESNGVTAVPVEGWHASLTNGFKNGIGKFFKGDPSSSSARKLVIMRADLDFVPTAMFARGAQVVGAAAVVARVRYLVRVVAADGQVLARDQGEVLSTTTWTQAGGSSTTATEAIAQMYQNISKQIAGVSK